GLGSVVSLTDASGNAIVRYWFEPFGHKRAQSGTSSNYWLYTGEQRDSELGFIGVGGYYLRARYYDPYTGRFLSRDPLPGGNPYGYVGNNPVNLIDPYGLIDCGTFGLKKACKKVGDCASDPVECGEEATKEVANAVTSGPIAQDLLSVADILPLSYGCALGGAAIGAGAGFLVGGVGAGPGAAGGLAFGYAACEIGEKGIGVLAAHGSAIQIANSQCSWENKAAAGVLTLVNLGVDAPPFPWDLIEKPIEVGTYVAINELLDCKE
ncbi:MAG: RHS repeat domain-containing protein, partial [Acidimicrobiia bacterium]